MRGRAVASLAGFFQAATLLVILAALLDILANICVAASRGFKRIWLALGAYVLVGGAFFCLSLAVKSMDLAVAYAMWGAFGMIGTVLAGWLVFKQRPGALAWLGIAVLIAGMILLH